MKLYILAVIIIILISCNCFLNYKEGMDNVAVQSKSLNEGEMLDSQSKYAKNREFENVAEGDAETALMKVPDYNDSNQSKMKKTDPGAYLPNSETDDKQKECEVINKTKNCKNLKGSRCGYCHSNKTFMYVAPGDKGPSADSCPKMENGEKAFVGPDDPRGVSWVCQKFKEQEKCSKVKNCGGSTGEASICGWCPTAQKGMVLKQDSKGGYYPKYDDDTCNFEAMLNDGDKTQRVQVGWKNKKLIKKNKKLYLYKNGQYKGDFTPTKVRSYSWGIYAYTGWRIMVYFSRGGGDKVGVWTGESYTNHVMNKSNWIAGQNGHFKWAPTGWELRTDQPVKFKTSLINVKDCEQFKQLYPCMGPNWNTGPHTQACIQKKWDEGGCEGEVDDRVSKSGLNLHKVKQQWNSKGHGALLQNVKTFVVNTSSTDFDKAKIYTKACYGSNVSNCNSRWEKRPKSCDQDMWRWSGCATIGKMNPDSKEPWAIDFDNPYNKYDKNKNKDGNHSWGKVWNEVWRTRWLSDHHTRNPKQDYGKTIKYTLACRGKVPPAPWKKPCWKDFTDICRYCLGVTMPTANKLSFKNAHSDFRNQSKTELKRTNVEADSNMMPRMLGPDWLVTETSYKLADFPYWNFTNKIIPALKSSGGNTGVSWSRNFVREMTKVPGVLYVGHLRPPTPNRLTKSNMDELWFSNSSPFYRLIKRFKLPTTRYKGTTYTRLYQSRYKAKQDEYGFEYGFPYWSFFQAAAAN
tara:strand:+ start:1270 stop:3495 length:2226 start_codon:yes stop_codon:yes gene_type:complete